MREDAPRFSGGFFPSPTRVGAIRPSIGVFRSIAQVVRAAKQKFSRPAELSYCSGIYSIDSSFSHPFFPAPYEVLG